MPDGEPVRQSERLPQYAAALDALGRNGLLFPCGCSRREIAANLGAADEPRCVGDCRRRRLDPSRASLRVALERLRPARIGDRSGRTISFEPAVQTDLVVRRRDGIVAYHLATVVDDAAQGITDVVRGGDLLSSTGWQLGLQQALGLPTPRYLHLPVVTEPDGGKLSKSARALPLDPGAAPALLRRALELLGQPPLPVSGDLATLWREAIARWDPGAASRQPEVRA